MLVRECYTEIRQDENGKPYTFSGERMVEMPDVVTPEAQAPIDAANRLAEQTASTNGRTLEDQAIAALAANKVFYQRTSSTTGQVLAQVKALSRQNNALIRLLLKRLDGVD